MLLFNGRKLRCIEREKTNPLRCFEDYELEHGHFEEDEEEMDAVNSDLDESVESDSNWSVEDMIKWKGSCATHSEEEVEDSINCDDCSYVVDKSGKS